MRYGHSHYASIASIASAAASVAAPASVTLALPGSDVFPVDLFHLRRALIGGTLARAWFAFTHDVEGTVVVDFEHGGSSADPTVFETGLGSNPDLTGYTRVPVDLGATTQTAAQVVAAVVAALAGVGGGISAAAGATDSAGRVELVVSGGSALEVPAAVDITDEVLRGMWGAQRDAWTYDEDGTLPTGLSQPNFDGNTVNERGSIYLGTPTTQAGMGGRRVRLLGAYAWGTSGAAPRLGISEGPAYSGSTTPGTFNFIAQGEVVAAGLSSPAQVDGAADNIITTVFPTAVETADPNLWFQYQDSGGTPALRYRNHGQTPVGNGDFGVGQALHVDASVAPRSATDAFVSGYTPTTTPINVYMMVGAVFEMSDANGNFHADGSMPLMVGFHGPADHNRGSAVLVPAAGVRLHVSPAALEREVTAHRFDLPEYTGDIEQVAISRVVEELAADEDSRYAAYLFTDLEFPSTTAATLLSDTGPMGLTPPTPGTGDYQRHEFNTPIPMALGGGTRYVGHTFSYNREGGPLGAGTYRLPVFMDEQGPSVDHVPDVAPGPSSYLTAWTDVRTGWHDDMPGAAGGRTFHTHIDEYRSANITSGLGALRMPVDSVNDTYPATWIRENDAGDGQVDNSPQALALDRAHYERSGMAAVA